MNPDFHLSYGFSPMQKGGVKDTVTPMWRVLTEDPPRVVYLNYKCIIIARFDEAREAKEWVQTYGYLAEWMILKHQTGVHHSWSEDMRVSPEYEEWYPKTYKSKEEAKSESVMDIDLLKKQFSAPRYQVFLDPGRTRLIVIDTTPEQGK